MIKDVFRKVFETILALNQNTQYEFFLCAMKNTGHEHFYFWMLCSPDHDSKVLSYIGTPHTLR